MEDYDGDPLDWDTQGGDEQLRRGLKALDTALRCPICQGMLQVPVSLPCGHGFCSGCIRRYQESNTDGCPTCKAHKAQSIPRPYPAVRIDRLLKDAVEAFRPIRSKLLELLGKDEDAPIIIGQSGAAEPVDGKRRGSRGSTSSSGSNGDEEGSSSDGSGGGLLRSHQRRSAWYDRHYAKINYHNADEKSIRAALQTMGLPTHGGKDRLSQRHREFLLAVQTAKDAVTCGSRLPIKSQAQVIKEIMHLEKSRDEENARAAKRAKVGPGAKLPAAREAHLQSLVQKVKRQEQRRRASSSSSLSVSTAGGEEEEGQDGAVTEGEGREDDWRALDDMQEDHHGEQEEEEREPPGKGAAAGEDGGGESEPAAAPSTAARRGLSNGHASSPASSSAMGTPGSASRKRASPGADTTGSQSMVMRGRSPSSSSSSQHEEDVVDISQDDEEERRQTTPSSTSDTPRKRAARWSCEYCTLDNHPELEVCEACGNHRVKSTGHRVQEDQLRIMKEARRISPRGLPTARAGGSR